MEARLPPGAVRALRMMLGLEHAGDATERRQVGIARGALSALIVRGAGLAVSLVVVPVTVGYLGGERYGALMAIFSALAWVTIADLGLGNELNNLLAAAAGRNDAEGAREAVASAFWLLVSVTAVVLAAGGLTWRLVDWPAFLNVRTPEAAAEVGPAMGVAFLLACLAFPLSVVDRVLIALQRGATANAWALAGSAATLVAVIVAARTRGGMVALVLAMAGTSLLVKIVMTGWLFLAHRPALRPRLSAATRGTSARLLRRGSTFFVVQIAALVLFSTDNIIIARVLGAGQVTPYSVTWSLFGLTQVLTVAAFPYLWAAYGEALARGDVGWVTRMLRRSLVMGTAAAALLLLPLVLAGEPLIRIWAGPEAVPPQALLWWMAVWYLINTPAQAIAAFLNAAGKTAVQAWSGIATAVANVVLSILLARRFGITGVIAATVLSYMALSAPPVVAATLRTVRDLRARTASGA